jgi:hypothetical protein
MSARNFNITNHEIYPQLISLIASVLAVMSFWLWYFHSYIEYRLAQIHMKTQKPSKGE